MRKKELRKCQKLDIEHFLRTYFEMDNEDLINKLSKLSHRDLKKIALKYNVRLKKICFDDLTREMLYTGAVILVEDGFGNPAPYINPCIKLENEFDTILDARYISYEVEGECENDKYQGRQKTKQIKSQLRPFTCSSSKAHL